MSRSSTPAQSTREWLTGLVIMVATVVAFIGFARASLFWTLVVAAVIWIGLIMFLWSVGVRKKRSAGGRGPGA